MYVYTLEYQQSSSVPAVDFFEIAGFASVGLPRGFCEP